MLALLLSACFLKSQVAIMDAEQAVGAAEEAGAAQHAPHELTLARGFRDEAQRNQGRARYQSAEELARLSVEAAQKALQRAKRGATGGVVPEEKAVAPPPEPTPATPPAVDKELLEVMGRSAPTEPPPEEKKLDSEQFKEESP